MKTSDQEPRVSQKASAIFITVDREMYSQPNGECLLTKRRGIAHNLPTKRRLQRENPDSDVKLWGLFTLTVP